MIAVIPSEADESRAETVPLIPRGPSSPLRVVRDDIACGNVTSP
jgi:hypothetical protein